MTEEEINPRPNSLLVFIDETGDEDYSDPKNPTFGRGGCAMLGADYKRLLKNPWRTLKREMLGGANKPFHATDFGTRSRPRRKSARSTGSCNVRSGALLR